MSNVSIKSAPKALYLSLLVIAAGIAVALAGIGLKFLGSAREMVAFDALYIAMAVTVAITFIFGAIRYSLAVGITLGVVALHDQLLTLAVVALVSIALPQTVVMPVLVIFSIVFTYCQSWPVIRAMHELRTANSTREMDNEQIATAAVRQTAGLRLAAVIVAALLIVAGAVSGNAALVGALMPLAAGLIVSFYSSVCITPHLWVLSAARFGKRK
ncbi:MAG: hypothetical protein GX653_05640 [Clostridiales bacterium]|nr:hypothetical protein [Clostridiales bacterium]